jgi:hypothetical protein
VPAAQDELRGHARQHRECAQRIKNNRPHDFPPSIRAAIMYSLNESARDRFNVAAGRTDEEPGRKRAALTAALAAQLDAGK